MSSDTWSRGENDLAAYGLLHVTHEVMEDRKRDAPSRSRRTYQLNSSTLSESPAEVLRRRSVV